MGNTNPIVRRRVRLIALGVFFVLFIMVFAVRLIYFQLAMADKYDATVIADSDSTVRTVTVQAQRGSICDRNGIVLVKNAYTYDLCIEYGALPDERADIYKTYLGALALLRETNTKRASELSPFVGSYPDFEWSSEALKEDSVIHKKLLSVLNGYYVAAQKFPDAETAFKNVTAERLGQYIAQNFGIVTEKKDGSFVSDYSQEEIDALILLRYDLAASEFGLYNPYKLAENVDLRLVSAMRERHLNGITVRANAKRIYNYEKPNGNRYASHILGTIGAITAETGEYYSSLGYRLDATVGRSGCELAFEEYLHGTDGTMAIVEDSGGNIIETYFVKEPIAGKDVWLTIDITAQIAAEDQLAVKLEGGGVGGAVAATDPNTGAVIALASAPDNEYNRAISAYEPGSTFKVGMALAALNEGIIEPNTLVATYGSYNGMKCSHYSKDGYCCGAINAEKALERSCNYFFADIGDRLSLPKIKQYGELFGFGQPTGIEIGLNASTPEASGKLSDELAYMSAIGQLNSCTPLQISQYIAMIANGGTRYSAHLLQCVKSYADESTIMEKEPISVASLSVAGVSEEALQCVRRGMLAVVYGEDASSYVRDAFRSAGYKAAGKTGTAERAGQRDNAFFVAYAPYEEPKIVVTCFIEQGLTGGLAADAARAVIDAYSEVTSTPAG